MVQAVACCFVLVYHKPDSLLNSQDSHAMQHAHHHTTADNVWKQKIMHKGNNLNYGAKATVLIYTWCNLVDQEYSKPVECIHISISLT